MQRPLSMMCALGLGLGITGQASAAPVRYVVGVTNGQVGVSVCEPGGKCSQPTPRYPVDSGADAGKAKVESMALDGGAQVHLVKVPAKDGSGSWVLLLGVRDGHLDKLLSGYIDRPSGKLAGERITKVLIIDSTPGGRRLSVGKQYENASACGRKTTLGVQELDPKDLTWTKAPSRSLADEDRQAATRLFATRMTTPYVVEAPRLLRATVASSAVGGIRSGLTDGLLDTFWAEKRPGAGKGELCVMDSSREVPIVGFHIAVRHQVRQDDGAAGDAPADAGAAPKTFHIITTEQVFHVTMPEDAWLQPSGTGYRVALPKPIRADCVSLVLDEAYTNASTQVSLAELRAETPYDGYDQAKLVKALEVEGETGNAAATLLMRGGAEGVSAALAGYGSLSERGRIGALDVIETGACSAKTPFFVERLMDARPTADGDRMAARARGQLKSCRSFAATELVKQMRQPSPSERHVVAARELASLDPASAVVAIGDVLDKGKSEIRRELRSALSTAVRIKRARPAVERLFAEGFAARSLVARVDVLRAVGDELGGYPGAAAAFDALLAADQSFRTRYLLLPPAGALARAKHAPALAFLKHSLRRDQSPYVRAQAALAGGGIPAMVGELHAALADQSPRVRAAALSALSESGAGANVEAGIARLLAGDKWTFVRLGAARALGAGKASPGGDRALVAAIDDPSLAVRAAALQALGRRNSQGAAEAVHDVAADASAPTDVRVAAIHALGALCHAHAAPLLYKLAYRTAAPRLPYDRPLGLAALSTLGDLHPPDLSQKLAPLIHKGPSVPAHIRAIARDALGRSGRCGRQP